MTDTDIIVKIDQDKAAKLDKINAEKRDPIEKALAAGWVYYDEKNTRYRVDTVKLGRLLLSKYKLLSVRNGSKNELYLYHPQTGVWELISKDYLSNLIAVKLESVNLWNDYTSARTKKYILELVEQKTFKTTFGGEPPLKFNFKNGVWNWTTRKLEQHSHADYFVSVTDYALETAGTTPETDKYFDLIFGENAKTVREFIGYSFYPSYEKIQALLILLGSGGDGKSTFFKRFLERLIGCDNVASVNLRDLASGKENNFKLRELHRKHVNTASELSDFENKLIDTSTLKALTGGDKLNASVKGGGDIRFANYAKLWVATNELVSFRDTSHGWGRRIFVVDFHKIKSFHKEIDWEKIRQERGAFAYKCILAAYEAFERGSLTVTPSIEARRKDWQTENDSVQAFLDENCVTGENYRVNRRDLYQAYENWCNLEHLHALMNKNFTKSMRDKGFEVKRLRDDANGKRFYFFMGLKKLDF